jgi:hypothetical protein
VSTLLGFLGVGLAQLMSQLWTLVALVLEPGALPARCDVSGLWKGAADTSKTPRQMFESIGPRLCWG